MKCRYCQCENDKLTRLIYACDACPGVARVLYCHKTDPTETEVEPWLIQFEVNTTEYNILLCLAIQEHAFASYILNKSRSKDDHLISLDYIPDINPNNAKDWADRFYKLRTFI